MLLAGGTSIVPAGSASGHDSGASVEGLDVGGGGRGSEGKEKKYVVTSQEDEGAAGAVLTSGEDGRGAG